MSAVLETAPSGAIPKRSNELPLGWSCRSLQEIGELVTGSTPPKAKTEFYGGKFPLVKPGELLNCVVSAADDTLTDAGAKAADVAPEGSVLVSCIGNLGKVGLAACPVAFNQQVNAIIPHDRASSRWVFYAVQTPGFRAQLNSVASATTISIVNKGKFSKLQIPWAPLGEQRRIVAEIEKQFTRLDAGVASLKRVQVSLKRYRASVLKAACEGRLVPTEAQLARKENRSYESADVLLQRILKERREKWNGKGKYKEPVTPSAAEFGKLPAGWTWAAAEQMTNMITDGEHITPRRSESGILLLSARNILDGRLALTDVDYVPQSEYNRIAKRLVIEPGDVLLSCSGSVGRSAVAPDGLIFTLVRSVAVLKPLERMGKYLSLALRSPLLQQQISRKKTQTAQANIFQGKIKTLCVPLPPLAEQQRIVTEIERRLSVIDELKALVEANRQRAARFRQSLLERAFSGEF